MQHVAATALRHGQHRSRAVAARRLCSVAAAANPPQAAAGTTLAQATGTRGPAWTSASVARTRVAPCTLAAASRSFSSSPSSSGAASASASSSLLPVPPVPFFEHFTSGDFLRRTAITLGGVSELAAVPQESFTYQQLLTSAQRIAGVLQRSTGLRDLRGVTVCLLHSHGFHYSAAVLGIWLAGGIAVPLHPAHAKPELEYLVQDARAKVLLAGQEHEKLARDISLPTGCQLLTEAAIAAATTSGALMQSIDSYGSKEDFLTRQAMLIYTSGTTAKPKGVEWTHLMFESQMRVLCSAWQWTKDDHILHVLPLHHVHGVVNVLLCALYSGARVTWMKGKHGGEEIAREIMDERSTLTLFMAVPTVYSRILSALASMSPQERDQFKRQCQKLRLMVSGSAALPEAVLDAWEAASGHVLLERYGMSEAGMILSQSISPEVRRSRAQRGTVGEPLDGVEIKIVPKKASDQEEEEKWHRDADSAPGAASSSQPAAPSLTIGELRVRGPSIFRSYWHAPEKTAQEFDSAGWFKTGDIVARNESTHQIRHLGRGSVDILKSGGYKISAIDVERELLKLSAIGEVAVVGLPSQEYGQIVAAVVAPRPNADAKGGPLTEASIIEFAKTRLAKYQVPRRVRLLPGGLPKNAMGKVNKKQLVKLFDEDEKSPRTPAA